MKSRLSPVAETLTRRGIRFIPGEVTELDTNKCEVRIASATFPYDILLIASGAELDFAAVPGSGPADSSTQSTFTVGEVVRARDALTQVLASDQGRVVIISSWLLRSITWRGFVTTGLPCILDGSGRLRRKGVTI